MPSHYDRLLAQPVVPSIAPESSPLPDSTASAKQQAKARRAQHLAVDKHRPPVPTPQQTRIQLESREKVLLRELQVIEQELLSVRKQLAG